VSGCSRKALGSSAGAAASQATAVAPPVPNIPASAQVTSIPLPQGAGPLAGRLQQEAASRPVGAIKAETVFGVVQMKGIPLHEIQQYMGYPNGAKYCAGAKTPNDAVFLVVCEFADPGAAAQGKEKSGASFGDVPSRQFILNRSSLLTVRDLALTPESAGQAKLLATTFASL
jgi:hypothetical protein